MNCMFCHEATADNTTAHWKCGGILPDDPRHAGVSVADHIVRLLTPHRVPVGSGAYRKLPAPTLSLDELRARMRPELVEHFGDGLALAREAGAVCQSGDKVRLARTERKPSTPRDDGTEPGLFDLSDVAG
jgi:hypothetical protein